MPQPPAKQVSEIFICYRRDDSSGYAVHLRTNLVNHFGKDKIFWDKDTIEPGEDFEQEIQEAVGSCEVLIAIIGSQWLSSTKPKGLRRWLSISQKKGRRRIDNPKDLVRLEITAALDRGIKVIPIMVQGARMPAPEELPLALKKLALRQGTRLSDQHWDRDVDELIKVLERIVAKRQEARRKAAEQEEEAKHQRAAAQVLQTSREEKQNKPDLLAIPTTSSPGPEAQLSETHAMEDISEATVLPKDRGKRAMLLVIIAFVAVLAIVAVIWINRMPTGEQQSANQSTITQQTAPTTSAPTNATQTPRGMVYVPSGEFMMGRDDGDEYEKPAHRETVKAFFIDAYEVTCGDYERFVKEESHPPPQSWKGGACLLGAERKPVTGVNWGDAGAFCYARAKRLPTEQEWEFAARGTDGRRYPWGNEWRAGLANAAGASNGMVDVGSYQAGKSPFGAFDMVGNAWEWTTADMTAYPGGKLTYEVRARDLKVIRGGSYESGKEDATVTYRGAWHPRTAKTYDQTGFRCVKEIPQ